MATENHIKRQDEEIYKEKRIIDSEYFRYRCATDYGIEEYVVIKRYKNGILIREERYPVNENK